jgi:TetR/AcrR family transcriptional regulator
LYQNFEKIPKDKKKIIIDVCMEEFAKKGYEKASTNNIVKKAGIPKGTLFYYFKSKKKLYLYILDYAVDKFITKFNQENVSLSTDLFERFTQRGLVKLKIASEEPLLYGIIYRSIINTPDNLKKEIYKKYSKLSAGNTDNIYVGIDTSKFKDGMELKKTADFIIIFLEGFLNKHLDTFKQCSTPSESLKLYKKISDEVQEYFEILKKGIYK